MSDYVEFLWSSKLKSRGSYLTILEFMHIEKPKFRDVLVLLKSSGDDLYENHVAHSY